MIDRLRKKIDGLDERIVKLLNERAAVAKLIGRIKSEADSAVYMPERERNVLDNVVKISKGPLSSEAIADIYQDILNNCRDLQKTFKVAYLGPEATYTHQAAAKKFGKKAQYLSCKTIPDVFEEVEKKRADFGVVPIENSNEGMVYHTLDMFKDSELKILMEIRMNIHHYLLGRAESPDKVEVLYYFPQAYAQSALWIKNNLRNVKLAEASSTAESARMCDKPGTAAVASRIAAETYGLNVIAGPIEDYKQNVTRFLVISDHYAQKSGSDKTSIMFSIKDRVGALHDMLVPFKRNKINLTKIESRPTKQKPGIMCSMLTFWDM